MNIYYSSTTISLIWNIWIHKAVKYIEYRISYAIFARQGIVSFITCIYFYYSPNERTLMQFKKCSQFLAVASSF